MGVARAGLATVAAMMVGRDGFARRASDEGSRLKVELLRFPEDAEKEDRAD